MAPAGHLLLVPKPRIRGVPKPVELRSALQAQGLAPKTVGDYYRCATTADNWFVAKGSSAANAPADLVARYADTLPLTWSSRKLLRDSLRWYWRIVRRLDPPLAVIRIPPQPKGRCRALTKKEAYRLASTARNAGDHRGFSVFEGLYQAMRREEMARSRWVEFDGDMLRIVGKGMKERVIPTAPSVLEHPYFRHAVKGSGAASDFVFPGRFGGHVGVTTIWGWIKEIAEEAGVEGVTPHRLRHTCLATQNDVEHNLLATSEFAGHSRPETTAIYTRTKASAMRRAMMSVDYLNERPKRGRKKPPPEWPGQSDLFDDDEDDDDQ